MDSSFLLIALILVGLVGYMVYAKSQRDQRTFNSLYKPADERLFNEPTEMDANGSIAFEGDSDFTTQPFSMAAGNYKLMYWFPESVLVQVELYSEDGSDKETVAIKSGEGQVGFSVDSNGRYFCKIEPSKDDHWELEIRRLGLSTSSG